MSGRKLGSLNKDKRALRDQAASHGVDVVEMRMILLKDCFKTINNEIGRPRSRRTRHYLQAEEMAHKHLDALMPYLHGKLSNVTVTDETPRELVIRAPDKIASTEAWLIAHGPKIDAAIKPVLPIVRHLSNTLDLADDLGINDPNEVIKETFRRTDVEESELDKLRKGSKW
jgi:hypothetical protein